MSPPRAPHRPSGAVRGRGFAGSVPARPPGGERAACLVVLGVAALALSCWTAGGVAALVSGHRWPGVHPEACLAILVGVLRDPRDPRRAWPATARGGLPGPVVWYAALVAVWGVAIGVVAGAWRLLSSTRGSPALGRAQARSAASRSARSGAAWAGPSDVRRLAVSGPGDGRLVLGRSGRHLVAVERGQSVLVVGPTQSGKTSGFAIPALLEWEGPVVATSVKTDLLRETRQRRSGLGRVLVFDPTGVCGAASACWSPLAAASSWAGARRVAAGLCGVARSAGSGPEDAAFWYATAEKLLAPLLLAAACSGGSIADVVRWVDTGEMREVLLALELAGEHDALQAAEASFGREERQRSSVYTTAETVLAAYADPSVAATCARHEIDPTSLLDGGRDSLFLVAPAHEQERLQSVFVAIIRSVVEQAMTTSSRRGAPLEPPLLVVLDEAANIAPLAGLDALAATASSHGIQLVTVWQDLAQVEARYGPKAATVVNNHRAKILCSGIADASTLEQASRLIGDEEHDVDSSTVDATGQWSRTTTTGQRRLAPVDKLRCLEPGEAVLLYGHLPPLQIRLRPFYGERALRKLREGFSPRLVTSPDVTSPSAAP